MHKQSNKDKDSCVECTRCDQWYHCDFVGVQFREASSLKFFIANKLN